MRIILTDSRGSQLADINTWENANIASKAIFKREHWSDIYYHIFFDDGTKANGSIDLEPYSFHKPHQKEIFTNHLRTFWTNVSKAVQRFDITQEDREYATQLLTYLPI